MGDLSKFQNVVQFYAFHIALFLFFVSEIFIFIYSYQKQKEKRNYYDKGTKWLLEINYIFSVCFPFWCVSKKSPTFFEYFLLPYWTAYIGILAIIIGIIIRVIAVLTLKKAFTLNVQTTDKQVLVTTGIYTKVRNPAYSGSILSLIGVALALRNIFSVILIFLISIICYSIRIYVEEQALKKHFKKDFMNYQKHTYKLFPYIW